MRGLGHLAAVAAPVAALAVTALSVPAEAATRDDVARRWAPVIFQEVKDPIRDLYAAYDFDGDWNGQNNKQNAEACQAQGCTKLVGTVYFTVVETSTHWFVQYMPYHPVDFKTTNGHEHDTESVLAVVSKAGGGTGTLEAMEVRFHTEWLAYAIPSVTGGAAPVRGPIHFEGTRPAVYSQMVGHGLCGGFSPPNRLFPDLSLTCDHAAQPHIDQGGVVYSPDLPAQMPAASGSATARTGYAMVDLATSMWTHIREIGPGKAFKSAIDFDGDRCALFACPKGFGGAFNGDDGSSPGFPWAQDGGPGASKTGSQFFDPAYTMSRRLTFAQPFSLDYCFNPYLAVADACPAAPNEPPSAPTPQPTPAGAPPAPPPAAARSGDAASPAPDTGAGCACRLGAPASAPASHLLVALAGAALLTSRRRRRRA